MTPWAEMLLSPSSTDEQVRARFHQLAREEHPDARVDATPGPRWTAISLAYQEVRTGERRHRWTVRQAALAGTCARCGGTGVTERLLGRGRGVAVCKECGGEGRI